MFLRFRPALPSDLEECLPLGRDAFAFTAAQRSDLLRMWRDLLTGGAAYVIVIDDLDRRRGASLVYFSFSVFLFRAFADAALSSLPPCFGLQALDWWRRDCAPFLSLAQIRAANAPAGVGLDVACLHSGFREPLLTAEEGRVVRDKVLQVFLPSAAGFRINRFFIDTYSDWERQWALSAGIPVGNDHARHATGGVHAPSGRKACLMAVHRAEALAHEGSVIGPLFTYEPPRFGLSPGEQDLLLWALTGETDEELAQMLSLAPITLKKRWESIYGRICRVAPEFFGPMNAAEARRGKGKKRRVLAYVQHHMEELRPYLVPNKQKHSA